jgi:hypothetical protein
MRGYECRDGRRTLAQRALLARRDAEERQRAASPAPQRRPARHRRCAHNLRRARLRPRRRRGHVLVPPHRQCPGDRAAPVAIAARNARGHDYQDRVTRPASVPPSHDLRQRRRLPRRWRPLDCPHALAVTDDHQRRARRPARRRARRALRWPYRRARRRTSRPSLDVHRTLNDSLIASRFLFHRRRGARRTRCYSTAPPPLRTGRQHTGAPPPASPLRRLRSVLRETALREGHHHRNDPNPSRTARDNGSRSIIHRAR